MDRASQAANARHLETVIRVAGSEPAERCAKQFSAFYRPELTRFGKFGTTTARKAFPNGYALSRRGYRLPSATDAISHDIGRSLLTKI